MMENKVNKLIVFIKFLEEFRRIKRTVYLLGSKDMENDVEHSYQLAMVAWYLIDAESLPYDLSKVLRYCLAHDLVETYAGDTYFYTADESLRSSKKQREHDALLRIEKEFSEFPEMAQAIRDYESRTDEEARFVYAVDKLLPMFNIHISKGEFWQDYHVTFDMWLTNKEPKVTSHPEIKKYSDYLKPIIKEQFYKP